MKIINASINLSKIPKNKITKSKSEESWINVTIIVKDEKDKYDNDTSIQVQQSKEEREAKGVITYLGNGKTVFNNGVKNPTASETPTDDLPF